MRNGKLLQKNDLLKANWFTGTPFFRSVFFQPNWQSFCSAIFQDTINFLLFDFLEKISGYQITFAGRKITLLSYLWYIRRTQLKNGVSGFSLAEHNERNSHTAQKDWEKHIYISLPGTYSDF